jgi:hypothetical protein
VGRGGSAETFATPDRDGPREVNKADMPPHPKDACYCHVIGAGVSNIRRLTAAGDLAAVAMEAEHLEFVSRLLASFLLHSTHGRGFDELLHVRYWEEVRPAYAARACPESLAEMDIPWEFLASSLGIEYNASQVPAPGPKRGEKKGDASIFASLQSRW